MLLEDLTTGEILLNAAEPGLSAGAIDAHHLCLVQHHRVA